MNIIRAINSGSYWNDRFSTDWDSFEGPVQSRFFAQVALENIPRWLLAQIGIQSLTIADWGCAQGDGSDVLASYIDARKIVGVDFSSVAIDKAKVRYPGIDFICSDWLNELINENQVFDVVFSSNTLEHFYHPYEVLKTLRLHARKAIILALPYQERERIDEHFFTFLPENIPENIPDGFRLIWSKVIDCRRLSNTKWPGDQIVLVYADSSWLDGLDLKLSDISIEKKDPFLDLLLIEKLENHIADINQILQEKNERIVVLDKALVESRDRVAALNDIEVKYRQSVLLSENLKNQLNVIIKSKSWVVTRPARIVFRLIRYGFNLNDFHRLLVFLRPYGRYLPLSQKLRRRVSMFARNLFRRTTMRDNESAVSHAGSIKIASPQPNSRDYFIFGVIDWHFRHQRPQQLALQIASTGRRVFYISVDFVDSDEPGFSVNSLGADGCLFNLHLNLKGAPSVYWSPPSEFQLNQLRLSMGCVLAWADSTSIVSLVQHSFWFGLAKQMPNSCLVYDCMDYHEGFGGVSPEMIACERELLSFADLTVTTSSWLDQEVVNKTKRHLIIRNATDFQYFHNRPLDIYKDPLGRQIIGYYGAIAEWFDVDLLATVAETFSECAIVLVGADTVGAHRRLSCYKNVFFLGEVSYKDLPSYAHAFDVCLLPFKVIPLTLATNPVKVYEYLSMGKPVVSTDLPEVREMGAVCSVANDSANFVELVRRYLEDPGISLERQEFAKAQTWEHRAKNLIWASEDCSVDPLVSVVVVTYNNLDLTKQCLSSLEQYSEYPNMEVIVVDNNSSDGSQDWLRTWVEKSRNYHLILNQDNRGFAAGNNQGLMLASGEYLVMLNNDTHVTRGWVRTMVNHMRSNPSIGLLGPVTNNIGNEARIDIFYDDMSQMLMRAAQYTRAHFGQVFPLRTVAFFCVMLRRDIFQKIGPLDEAFGRGFFEDDDYCRRVEQAGMQIACAEDVFVHHHLSASFNKLKSIERQALFEENKKKYEAKWGRWVPHSFRGGKGNGCR